MELELETNLETALKYITDPVLRPTWDKTILEMDLIKTDTETETETNCRMIVKMPFPLKNREIIERQFYFYNPNEVILIFFSREEDSETNVVRGCTHIGYTKIVQVEDTVRCTVISQVNLKLFISQQKLISVAAGEMKSWARKLQRVIKEAK
jgi:hypothetical protein